MQADGMGGPQSVGAAQAVGQAPSMERVARREMKLRLLVNSLLIGAPLLAGQRLALVAQSIIGWPFVVDHQVELLWPLRTLLAEMPRLTTSMRSVFHGSTAFPEFACKKSLVCRESQSRGEQINIAVRPPPATEVAQRLRRRGVFERDLAEPKGANFWHSGHNLIFRGGLCRLRMLRGSSGHCGQFEQ